MNCRFCGNFVPDGNDSCPVCGRRPEEDPIGKLLSENRPGVPEEDHSPSKAATAGLKPQRIGGALLALCAGVAAWIYCVSTGIFNDLRTLFNSIFGVTSQTSSDSSYELGNAGLVALDGKMALYIALVVLGTVVGIIGLVSLIKRMINNMKYNA